MTNNNKNQFKNQLNQNSFFGQFLYKQIIPEDHFLKKLSKIIDNLIKDLPTFSQVTADKEYDTNHNHREIKKKQSESFIILKKNRKNSELLAKKESPSYQEVTLKRPIIERIFAEAKKYHGLAKSRWKGKWKMWIQALLTFIVINCKRVVSWALSPPLKIPVFSFQNSEILVKTN